MNLIEKLRALGEYTMSKDQYINYGGCAVYAAYVGQRLEQMGIKVHARVSTCGRVYPEKFNDLNTIRKECKPKNYQDWRNYFSFYHVFLNVEFDGTIWFHDAENTQNTVGSRDPSCEGFIMDGEMSIDEVTTIAAYRYGWNSAFDRKSGMPKIRAAVNKFLPYANSSLKLAA